MKTALFYGKEIYVKDVEYENSVDFIWFLKENIFLEDAIADYLSDAEAVDNIISQDFDWVVRFADGVWYLYDEDFDCWMNSSDWIKVSKEYWAEYDELVKEICSQ